MKPIFSLEDFSTPEGQKKIVTFLNFLDQWQQGVNEQLRDLVFANQEKLIQMGKAYAKDENLNYQ
jgi:hypothetical protein